MISVNKKNLIFPIESFVFSLFITYISVYVIANPDLAPYESLLNITDKTDISVEPTIIFISFISKSVSEIFYVDSIYVFYYIYIYFISFFLLNSFYNFSRKSILRANLLFVIWFFLYGTMHVMIQIRFGLANAIYLYLFSFFWLYSFSVKKIFLAFFSIMTHYSIIFSIASLVVISFKNKLNNFNYYWYIHLVFIFLLVSFKFSFIFSFLPDFIYIRLANYINNGDLESISFLSTIVSVICYLLMILSPKIKDESVNALRYYGALGFLPYFIVPDIEILVRLGVAFQYLLIPYLFLSFRIRKVLFFTTLPLVSFLLYKINSNFSSFLGYL